MYWICVFAVIMEVVFRIQETRLSWREDEQEKLPNTDDLLKIPDLALPDDLTTLPNGSLSPKSPKTKAAAKNSFNQAVYIVRNTIDGSYLSASCKKINNCIYEVTSITSVPHSDSRKNLLVFSNPMHEAFDTFMWEIIKKGRTSYIKLANIQNMTKWSFKNKETKLSSVISYKDYRSSVIQSMLPSSYKKKTQMPPKRANKYDSWNSNLNSYSNLQNDPPISNKYANGDIGFDEIGNNDKNMANTYWNRRKRSVQLVEELKQGVSQKVIVKTEKERRKRSLRQLCHLYDITIQWKLKWGLASSTTKNKSLVNDRYQIRDLMGNCVKSKGISGKCQPLNIGSNCYWEFVQLTQA